jgi:hypothetical protein
MSALEQVKNERGWKFPPDMKTYITITEQLSFSRVQMLI